MACYKSNIYTLDRFYVDGFEIPKYVYLLPDDEDVETAIQRLLIEDLDRQQAKWNEIDIGRLHEYAISMHFASKEVLYVKDGDQYHEWIKNPHERAYVTKAIRNYVDGIVNNYLSMKLSVSEMPIMMDAI